MYTNNAEDEKILTCCGHLTLATLAGTSSASSESVHLIKNISSPVASEAPEIYIYFFLFQ